MRDAEVLRLVHDRKVEHHPVALRDAGREGRKQLRMRNELAFTQGCANALEDRPQPGALRLREPRLSAEPHHIPVRLPAIELPRVNHVLPFRQQKEQAELVTGRCRGGLAYKATYGLAAGDLRLPDVRSVEAEADRVERVNVDALGEPRL